MGRRPRMRGRRRADRRSPATCRRRGRARGSRPRHRRPHRGRAASACCRHRAGRRACALKRGSFARSRTSRGGSSGSASDGDPLRLRHPDREVGDDRAGAGVERMADLGHAGGQRVVALGGVARSGTERRQERDREEQRPEDPEQRSEPGDRPRPAEPDPDPGDERVEGEECRDDQQHVERSGRVEERPPGRGDREDEAGDEEGAEADDDDRSDRRAADRPREPDQAR